MVNNYLAELIVLIRECSYAEGLQDVSQKDQLIFGITAREIQEHLLNETEDDHDLAHCLQEARKIKSHIAQCKLLGLKSVQYDAVVEHSRSKKKKKIKDMFLIQITVH